jgi:hypothetical protein
MFLLFEIVSLIYKVSDSETRYTGWVRYFAIWSNSDSKVTPALIRSGVIFNG